MPPLAFLFIDGLGLGDPDKPDNPLRHPSLDIFANFHESGWAPPREGGRPPSLPQVERRGPMPWGGVAVATDASLGVPGLPQSATGQTTLFTGKNGAEALGGRHYTGFPTKTLRGVLLAHSVFKSLTECRRKATFLNAFTPRFFALGDAVWKKPMGATSWAVHAAGLRFRSLADLEAGRAVFHDITHDSTPERRRLNLPKPPVLPPRTPEEAGAIFAQVAHENDFTLFEFFQTDKAGHKQDRAKAEHELVKLERFCSATLGAMNLGAQTLVVTSDHGNVEDLSTRMHTHNPVPTLVFGRCAGDLASRLGRLEAFAPAILEIADS